MFPVVMQALTRLLDPSLADEAVVFVGALLTEVVIKFKDQLGAQNLATVRLVVCCTAALLPTALLVVCWLTLCVVCCAADAIIDWSFLHCALAVGESIIYDVLLSNGELVVPIPEWTVCG